VKDLARTLTGIAAERPTVRVNGVLWGAFERLYAEARGAGVPELPAASGWSRERAPTYAELVPVVAQLARQPAIAPRRPSGLPKARAGDDV
jgi:hypothetical protein